MVIQVSQHNCISKWYLNTKDILFSALKPKYTEESQMANITISNLRPADADLFDDSENYLKDLSDMELSDTNGGLVWLLIGVGILAAAAYGGYELYTGMEAIKAKRNKPFEDARDAGVI
jgi:hypothetical protein